MENLSQPKLALIVRSLENLSLALLAVGPESQRTDTNTKAIVQGETNNLE